MKTLDFCPHPDPQRGVEVAQRLVEQKNRRPPDQRSGDVDPLLLSAAQGCWFQIEQIFDLHVLSDFAHPFFDLVRTDTVGFQIEGKIFANFEWWIESVVLKRQANPAIFWVG